MEATEANTSDDAICKEVVKQVDNVCVYAGGGTGGHERVSEAVEIAVQCSAVSIRMTAQSTGGGTSHRCASHFVLCQRGREFLQRGQYARVCCCSSADAERVPDSADLPLRVFVILGEKRVERHRPWREERWCSAISGVVCTIREGVEAQR
jgi:hypothetical protein